MSGKARLDIDIVDHGEAVLVRPVGWVVANNYVQVERKLAEVIDQGHLRMVVDLSVAQVLASSLLGVLLRSKAAVEGKGGRLILCAPARSFHRMVTAAGLEDALVVCSTVPEAVKRVREGNP